MAWDDNDNSNPRKSPSLLLATTSLNPNSRISERYTTISRSWLVPCFVLGKLSRIFGFPFAVAAAMFAGRFCLGRVVDLRGHLVC